MTRALKVFLFAGLILLLIITPEEVSAQCAMCRATLENNVSNGEVGIAENLNAGILYLFATPYLVVAFIAYMWYRRSKENAKNPGYTTR